MGFTKDEFNVLSAPLVTEGALQAQTETNTYAFRVPLWATKTQVRGAVEKRFDVDVLAVRTSIVHGKTKRVGIRSPGRLSNWKKAFVKIADGQKIDIEAI